MMAQRENHPPGVRTAAPAACKLSGSGCVQAERVGGPFNRWWRP